MNINKLTLQCFYRTLMTQIQQIYTDIIFENY